MQLSSFILITHNFILNHWVQNTSSNIERFKKNFYAVPCSGDYQQIELGFRALLFVSVVKRLYHSTLVCAELREDKQYEATRGN